MNRFDKTACSQCGSEFGPGDQGYSHCSDHDLRRKDEALKQIAASLNVMLGSAVALVDGIGDVVGYQIKTGALHRILGHMASVDHPVTVPLCRTQIVLNHESSPWPLEGKTRAAATGTPT